MSIDTKLKEMGLVLPKATDPVGSYVATKISGNLLYISGQISCLLYTSPSPRDW